MARPSRRRGRGEGSVFQRGDGRWTAALVLENGRRRIMYGRTRAEVVGKLAKAKVEAEQGLLVEGTQIPMRAYLQRWLADMVRPSVRPSTYTSYELNTRRLDPYIGFISLNALRPPAIQRAYAELTRSGLAARTVEQAHTVLHRALQQAVLWGLIGRNPADAVTTPRPKRIEMKFLTGEQVRVLFEATRDHRMGPLWVVLATTGIRLGEALGLTWADVDLHAGKLVVRRALQRIKGEGLVLVEPKTSRSQRSVYLSAGAIGVLKAHRATQAAERLCAGQEWSPQPDLVFRKESGRPLDNGHVNWSFHRALERAGLPRVRVHDLRHTAASYLFERGVHPKVVQEMLGHSTITLTLDTYSHIVPSLQAEAAARMQDLFTYGEASKHVQERDR